MRSASGPRYLRDVVVEEEQSQLVDRVANVLNAKSFTCSCLKDGVTSWSTLKSKMVEVNSTGDSNSHRAMVSSRKNYYSSIEVLNESDHTQIIIGNGREN